MLETPHVVVGAAIATKVANPALAIPLALGSHFVLDKLPHWNPHLYSQTQKNGHPDKSSTRVAIIDVALAFFLGLFLAFQFNGDPTKMVLILACSLASVLPDVVKWPYYYLGSRYKPLVAWVKFERTLQVDASFVPGVASQIAVIAAALIWIFA